MNLGKLLTFSGDLFRRFSMASIISIWSFKFLSKYSVGYSLSYFIVGFIILTTTVLAQCGNGIALMSSARYTLYTGPEHIDLSILNLLSKFYVCFSDMVNNFVLIYIKNIINYKKINTNDNDKLTTTDSN